MFKVTISVSNCIFCCLEFKWVYWFSYEIGFWCLNEWWMKEIGELEYELKEEWVEIIVEGSALKLYVGTW